MADKAVERVEPPYPDHWDAQVKGDDTAYVIVYTHVDDSIESVAFNRTGGEIKRMAGDFRRPATKGVTQAVGRAEAPRPAVMTPADRQQEAGRSQSEVIPGVPAVSGHVSSAQLPLPSKPLPEPEAKSLKPKP